MEERRKRTPKKPEHPVREWISDNLRYLLLFGGLLLIIVITMLLVKLLSGKTQDTTPAQAETKTESTIESVSAEEEETAEDSTNKEHLVAAATPTPTATPEANETDAAEMTKEADAGMFTELIKKYFGGLSSQKPEVVRSCVDTFSDEDFQQVAENTQITSYTDIEVYTCPGTDDNSRVAFVKYHYTMAGSDVAIPALTQFYIYDRGDGDWRLASDTSDTAIQQRFSELTETDTVKAMISSVQEEYNQVISEHPELK